MLDFLGFCNNIIKIASGIINLLFSVLRFIVEILPKLIDGFIQALNFLNAFLFDFLLGTLNLFDGLPPVYGFGLSVVIYFIFFTFWLKLLKLALAFM